MPKQIKLKKGHTIIVDDCDFDLVSRYTWNLSERYIRRSTSVKTESGKWKAKIITLHCEIMQPPKGFCVDHINGDIFDNRRCNLRICTHGQNMQNQKIPKNNKSGFKGVSWNSKTQKWAMQFIINKKRLKYKLFDSPLDAAKAYNDMAKAHYGEFARINEV